MSFYRVLDVKIIQEELSISKLKVHLDHMSIKSINRGKGMHSQEHP